MLRCFLVLAMFTAGSVSMGYGALNRPLPGDGRVIIKFTDEAGVRLTGPGLVSRSGADLGPVGEVLSAFGHPVLERLFARSPETIDRELAEARRRSGRALADLNGYYETVVSPELVPRFIEELERCPAVQTAYPAPPAVPPPGDIPPTTPDFAAQQGYLGPAPGGIDAHYAWTVPGGRGEGIYIVDIEYEWRDTHEDLEAALGGKICWTPKGAWIDHGTAVLGEVIAGDNAYGVTGIVNRARVGMATQDPVGLSNSVARAINCAASHMQAGDVMLLEAQTTGPRGNYVPVEWDQAEFDAIQAATALGISVVEAAGNGNENLDDAVFGGKFDRAVRDSGAIIVGAGATPSSGQPDRSRLSFSTYGSRVDVQGWGELVTTSGYGDLFQGGGDPNQGYTRTFNGTSSASPIVTGAAVALQGVQKAGGGSPLAPEDVRRILTETGTPQQAGPYSGQIGPRPNLRLAIEQLAILFVSGVEVDDAPPLGNASGAIDPGETAILRARVGNRGTETATAVRGVLRSADPAVRITRAAADWPDLGPGEGAYSLPPHQRVTLQPGAACGTRLAFTLDLTSDQYGDRGGFALEVGTRSKEYPSPNVPLTIPKSSSQGVTSTLEVQDDFSIVDAQASLNIAHQNVGELRVVLRSPDGVTVVLHDHSRPGTANINTTYDRLTAPDGPGTMNSFDGHSSKGTWVLWVVDNIGSGVPAGSLNAWSLELTAGEILDCDPLECAAPVPPAAGDSLRVGFAGEADLLFTWQALPAAAAYRVWQAEEPGMGGAALAGQTAGTSLVQPGGRTGPARLVFYQLRAVNSCEWEGP